MELGKAFVTISADSSQLVADLNTAKGKVGTAADSMTKKLAGIGKGMTIAGGVITAAVAGTFKTFTNYETKLVDMAKVTGESFESIEEKISAIDPILGSSTELMTGYYQVISAGVKDPVEALETLTTAAKAGKAAHVEQSEVVKGITKMMAGYEGEISSAAEAADLLFSIEKEGQTTVAELIPVIGGLAKMSYDLGIGQEEMAASMAVVTKTAGSTAEAATQYQGILSGLMKPTESMTEAFEAIGEKVRGIGEGYEDAAEMIEDLGLVEALKQLKKHSEESGVSMAKLFGRKEAMIGFSALGAKGFETLDETIVSVGKGMGSAEEAFINWSKTGEAAITEIKNTFINFGKDIGKVVAPMIKELLGKVTDIIEKITEWIEANPELTEKIILWGAAIGGIMVVLGPLLMALPGLVTLIGALLSPIGLVVVAAGALYLAFTNWDKLIEIVGNIKDAVIVKIEEWSVSLNKWWDTIIENTDNKWLLVADKIIKAIGYAYEWLVENIGIWILSIAEWWENINTDTETWWTLIRDVIVNSVKAWINFFWETLPQIILDIINWWDEIRINTETIWKAIKTAIVDAVQGIWDKIVEILGPIVEFVSGLWKSINSSTSTIWGSIKSTVTSAVSSITSAIEGMITAINNAWETAKSIYDKIKSILAKAEAAIAAAPTITTGVPVSEIIEAAEEEAEPWPTWGYHQAGIPYVPKTGLYGLHKGEAVIPASQNTYNQQKSYSNPIYIQPGAIVINTPRFSGRDAKEMLAKIKREAAMQGYKFATA